jgi:hypothetical protein
VTRGFERGRRGKERGMLFVIGVAVVVVIARG